MTQFPRRLQPRLSLLRGQPSVAVRAHGGKSHATKTRRCRPAAVPAWWWAWLSSAWLAACSEVDGAVRARCGAFSAEGEGERTKKDVLGSVRPANLKTVNELLIPYAPSRVLVAQHHPTQRVVNKYLDRQLAKRIHDLGRPACADLNSQVYIAPDNKARLRRACARQESHWRRTRCAKIALSGGGQEGPGQVVDRKGLARPFCWPVILATRHRASRRGR